MLEGIRVIEIGAFVGARLAGMTVGDLRADARRGGDEA